MAVLGANSPEWFSCAVGAVMAGGVVSIIIGILLFVISMMTTAGAGDGG